MKNLLKTRNLLLGAVPVFFSSIAIAALVDETLVNDNGAVNVTNGTITRSLSDQIGTGTGDQYTPYSSAYIIRHDPLRSVRRGRQLFQRKFSDAEGIGPRDNFGAHGDITQTRRLGAGSADSCSTCHGSPKGSAGFGGNVATFPDGRDAPHLFGLGIVEQLAEEITENLRSQRQVAVNRATNTNREQRQRLTAKGINYGSLIAYPDGTVDASNVSGIDEDLRVKPFFAQGQTISMREFIIGAFKDEMGLESWDPVLCAVTDPDNPQVMVSQSGFVFDPTLDEFERPANCEALVDNDNDGIIAELDPSLVDHLEFYLLNYFKPATGERNRFTDAGREHLDNIGCTGCHKADLVIDTDRRVADVETQYDPVNGIFNDLFSTASGRFNVVDEGGEYPAILPQNESFVATEIFTDLKRHDLGPNFHERDYDGTIRTHFMTEPLWGVGSSAPYGHDGRSISLDQVIKRHGGEAEESSNAYRQLSATEKRQLLEYLRSLQLFPPDDTASNLNPGVKGGDPQNEHGSIKLPELFQIPEYGNE